MNISPLREISNPAAMGWEWSHVYESAEGSYDHQISWTRGTNSLHYGSRNPGGRNWTNTLIVAPERFGFEGTLESARKAARTFYEETLENTTNVITNFIIDAETL